MKKSVLAMVLALCLGGFGRYAPAAEGDDYCCPVPDQPTGLVVENEDIGKPELDWQEPLGGADEYYVEVLKNGKSFLKQWCDYDWRDHALWGAEFVPAVYHARVSAKNLCGKGPATRWLRFEVPTCVTGTPDLHDPPDKSPWLGFPTWFEWTDVTDAKWYKLIVQKGTKTYLNQTIGYGYGYGAWNWYEPWVSSREKDLPMGIYQWKVQAYTPCGGWGPAGTSTFAVVCSSAPEAAQPEDMWVDQHFWETGSMASPRPRFGCENMDDASWCYFDIKRRSGATLVAVGKGWQRVDSWWDEDLGEEFYNATWEAPKDLPAGEYVWSVKKWNPCGYSLTCVVTSTVICVSPDAPTNLWVEVEDADDDDRCRPALAWSVVDNVFTYKMEIQRNGAPFKNLTSLEIWDWDKGARPIWEEVDPDDWRLVGWYWVSPSSMPDGTYRFRVRSYNGGCVPEKQNSSWSDWCTTTVYTVLGPPTTITDPAGVISTVSSTTWEWGCDLAWTPVKNALSYYVDWSLTGLPPCKKRSYVKSWIEEWDYWYDEVDGKNHIWVPFAIPDGLHAMTMKARNCRNQVGAASSVHSFAVMNEW